MILKRLKEVSQSETELKKYFSQLDVLSRLRNLNEEIFKNISAMPITIDIEKDYLYKKGLELGKVKGETKGKAETTYEATINMLQLGFEISVICKVLNIMDTYVLRVKKELEDQVSE